MKLLIAREYNENETLSHWTVFDGKDIVYKCVGIELPWKMNKQSVSCIPEGIFDVIKVSTPKHPNSFLVLNVPARNEIMIHKGNFSTGKKVDTEGCLLPGDFFSDLDGNGTVDVAASTRAMKGLNSILPDKFQLIII